MTFGKRGLRRRNRLGATALACALLVLGTLSAMPAAAQAPVERLVLVMDPLTSETNRFWGTAGDLGLHPSLHRLIGNDPVTGAYVNTALAESWEASDDFRVWTFRLKPEAEWHFGWGPSPRTTWC